MRHGPTMQDAGPTIDAPLLAALETLHRAAFPEAPWSAAVLADLCATRGAVLVTEEEDGVLQGFALARATLDEAELLTIAVHPTAQGRGIGRRLMARLTETLAARGVTRLHLEVAADNAAARALYAACGLVETGRRRGYYRTGRVAPVDALLLTLSLRG